MQAHPDRELTVPVGRVRPSRWRGTALATGIAGAIVGVGLLGGDADAPVPPLPSPRSTVVPAGPAVEVAVVEPASGATLETGRVRVSGTATPATEPLEVRILVAGIIVGRSTVVPGNGIFAADVPVLGPYGGEPLAATVVVSHRGSPGERLVQRDVVVRPASVVGVHDVSLHRRGDASVVVVRGTAALDVRRMRVQIETTDGRAAAEAAVGYRSDSDFVEAVLGYGTGDWTVTVPISFSPGPASVTVSWRGRPAGGQTTFDLDLRAGLRIRPGAVP